MWHLFNRIEKHVCVPYSNILREIIKAWKSLIIDSTLPPISKKIHLINFIEHKKTLNFPKNRRHKVSNSFTLKIIKEKD